LYEASGDGSFFYAFNNTGELALQAERKFFDPLSDVDNATVESFVFAFLQGYTTLGISLFY